MSNSLLNKIDVTIAGRSYPIKVTPEEESIVRTIEKKLNQQIRNFQMKYPEKDKIDCILMTMLTNSFDHAQKANKSSQKVKPEDRLSNLETLLDSVEL